MIRILACLPAVLCAATLAAPARAQPPEVASESADHDTGEVTGEVIDILVPVLTPEEQAKREECERLVAEGQERGEIVVCAEDPQSSEFLYSGSREQARDRYARETMNQGNPQTPDPCGPQCGIFTGPPTVSELCGFIFNPCPPDPALLIDVTALPPPPAGSDADRIARGLPPLNVEVEETAETAESAEQTYSQEELGLPPVPDFGRAEPGDKPSPVPQTESGD